MARTVAIFLGVWVAISIPTGIVIGRLLATASRLPRSGPRLEAERRGSRAASCRHSIEPTRLAGRRLAVLRGEAVSPRQGSAMTTPLHAVASMASSMTLLVAHRPNA
jgi:hypothetical protein